MPIDREQADGVIAARSAGLSRPRRRYLLHSYPSGSTVTRQELALLLAFQFQPPNWLWSAVADRAAVVSFWASALDVNTLMTLGATPTQSVPRLTSWFSAGRGRASWLVRLKFWLSDQTGKFGSIPESTVGRGYPTVSWVLPTSMALITLECAKKDGGSAAEKSRTGCASERRCSLIGRVREAGGIPATLSSTVFPLRPQIDGTTLALAALRFHSRLPIVHKFRDLNVGSHGMPLFRVRPPDGSQPVARKLLGSSG
jgi:hypothetical protein